MGDRCHLEMTMRRSDLPKFAPFVGAEPGDTWWSWSDDDLADGPPSDPCTATVHIDETNYAWYEERHEAAKAGISFLGTHTEGGNYGAHAFASLDGEMLEAELTHEGFLAIAVDEDLKPVAAPCSLLGYVAKARALRALFSTPAETPDQPQPRGGTP